MLKLLLIPEIWLMIETKRSFEQLNEVKEYLFSVLFPSTHVITPTNLGNIANLLLDLSEDSLNHLINVQFLLSKETELLASSLDGFLNNMERTTERVADESAFIRGHIDWGQTVKLQTANMGMPVYASKIPQRQFDTPYNQLVKYMLDKLKKIIVNTRYYMKTEEIKETEVSMSLKNKIFFLEKKVDNILNTSIVKGITLINFVPQEFIEQVRHMRNPLYKLITDLYSLYQKIYIKKDLAVLANKIFERILFLQDENKLFELVILFNIAKQLDSFQEKLGGKRGLEILGNKKDVFAVYRISRTKITLRYQKVTKDLRDRSEYKYYLDQLDMTNIKSRMPDILMTFEHDGETRHILVEVKNSNNRSYILESIYKMFGYLNDFQKSLLPNEVQGVLIVQDGITRPVINFQEKLWTIRYKDVKNAFHQLLEHYIK